MKSLAASLLRRMGWRLVRTQRKNRLALRNEVTQRLIEAIVGAPGQAEAHAAFSRHMQNRDRPLLAHAQARNAKFLAPASDSRTLADATARALPPLLDLGHNTYHRMQAMVRVLRQAGLRDGDAVLDVGGGKGELAAFLPGCPYFLVDPGSNGLDVAILPGDIGPFDYVVSCHVLEHIPPPERDSFLDGLVARARQAVVLLNPFHIQGASEGERLQLVVDLTGAEWAMEHLACTLPLLADVQAYAADRGLSCTVEPVGALTTTLAYVLMEHYGRRAGMGSELRRIDRFFNERLCDAEASDEFPTGYAVTLRRLA